MSGNSRPVESFTTLGVEVLDPIQPIGPAMQPKALKKAFGEQLCFHGGLDMQDLLPQGTPSRVRRAAKTSNSRAGERHECVLQTFAGGPRGYSAKDATFLNDLPPTGPATWAGGRAANKNRRVYPF